MLPLGVGKKKQSNTTSPQEVTQEKPRIQQMPLQLNQHRTWFCYKVAFYHQIAFQQCQPYLKQHIKNKDKNQ